MSVEHHEQPTAPEPSRRWIGPVAALVGILVPVLILVFSNTHSVEISWGGWSADAPLWIILAITFAAGSVVTRAFGAAWRVWRKRRKRLKAELDVLRKHAG